MRSAIATWIATTRRSRRRIRGSARWCARCARRGRRRSVIVTADHGEEFGDHGGRYHGTTVYEEQVRVPLVVNAPGLVAAPGGRAGAARRSAAHGARGLVGSRGPRGCAAETSGRCSRAWRRPSPAAIPRRACGASRSRRPTRQTMLARGSRAARVRAEDRGVRAVRHRARSRRAARRVRHAPRRSSRRCARSFARWRPRTAATSARSAGARGQGLAGGAAARARGRRRRGARRGGAARRRRRLDPKKICRGPVRAPPQRRSACPAPGAHARRGRRGAPLVALALTRLGEGAPHAYDLLADSDLGRKRLAALALAEAGDDRGVDVLVAWWIAAFPAKPEATRDNLVSEGAEADPDPVRARAGDRSRRSGISRRRPRRCR